MDVFRAENREHPLAHGYVVLAGFEEGDIARRVVTGRTSKVDLHAPIDDERFLFTQVKRGVQKLILWYMDYLVRQLSTFAGATTRAVRLLGDRLERPETRHEVMERRLPEVGEDLALLSPAAALDRPVADAVIDALRDT